MASLCEHFPAACDSVDAAAASSSSSSQEDLGLQVARARSSKKRKGATASRSTKRNLRQTGPLRLAASSRASDTSDAASLAQLEALYLSLPRSAWARHKLKVVTKAIELLKRGQAARTAAEAAELQQLLGSLNLAPAPRASRGGAADSVTQLAGAAHLTPAAAAAAASGAPTAGDDMVLEE